MTLKEIDVDNVLKKKEYNVYDGIPLPEGSFIIKGYNQCLNEVQEIGVEMNGINLANIIHKIELLDHSRSKNNPRKWHLTSKQSLMLAKEIVQNKSVLKLTKGKV